MADDRRSDRPQGIGPMQGDDCGRAYALRCLSYCHDAAALSRLDQGPDDPLVDAFLDFFPSVEPADRLHVLSRAIYEMLTDRTEDALLRAYVLLDPDLVQGASLMTILAGTLSGERVRPFGRWLPSIVSAVIEEKRFMADASSYPLYSARSEGERAQAIMASMMNRLDAPIRHLFHLVFIDERTIDEIVEQLGWPKELVELRVDHVVRTLTAAMEGREGESPEPPEEPGSSEFWDTMGREAGE